MGYILHLSGGGTKGIGQLGACLSLHDRGIRYKGGSGISIGAVLLLPVLMGKIDDAIDLMDGIELDDFFRIPPVNDDGKLTGRAITRALTGKDLGDQSRLMDRIREIISEGDFEDWKKHSGQDAYIGSVDYLTGKLVIRNLRDLYYEDMPYAILASASIPIFTEPVTRFGMYEHDGGVRAHIIASEINKVMGREGDTSISIYTRPEDYEIKYSPKKRLGHLPSILNRTVDIMNIEISKNDELANENTCNEIGIENLNIFLPSVLESPYDVNFDRMRKLLKEGEIMGWDLKIGGISTDA